MKIYCIYESDKCFKESSVQWGPLGLWGALGHWMGVTPSPLPWRETLWPPGYWPHGGLGLYERSELIIIQNGSVGPEGWLFILVLLYKTPRFGAGILQEISTWGVEEKAVGPPGGDGIGDAMNTPMAPASLVFSSVWLICSLFFVPESETSLPRST